MRTVSLLFSLLPLFRLEFPQWWEVFGVLFSSVIASRREALCAEIGVEQLTSSYTALVATAAASAAVS